jgi:hypothetical protein
MIGAPPRTKLERYLEYTQPRLRPAMTSHQRQPFVQPITFTGVPGWSQVTSGNARSGPARTLTACVVNAVCASAGIGSSRNSATKVRFKFAGDIGISIAGTCAEFGSIL